MLQIKNISKQYKTGELVQQALDGVSLNLRSNEFVAVLGPSGSGKTTLLNIIGGLDRYDSGDLIINGKTTKAYNDRDWDTYRNHTIGFVFQSYNLIPHQSVLANVELALTISGISKRETRQRSIDVLTQVGLADQIHKRPNQLSGGQMQRVAIARALVNDPDILLADEPTGAIDSETSIQIMNLLQAVAKERLVIMVTHNTDLAEKYANRIVKLHDGKIIADSNPYVLEELKPELATDKKMGKTTMSFMTALSLSFNNLYTKKARTILTAFAGSIGIIGIALILSMSTGLNNYIINIQRETMVSYPITIEAQAMDLSSMFTNRDELSNTREKHDLDGVYANSSQLARINKTMTRIKENNLTAFKQYLDDPNSEIRQYFGVNGIVYSYDVRFDVYAYDPEGELINTDGSSFEADFGRTMGIHGSTPSSAAMGGMHLSSGSFTQLLPGRDGELISDVITDNYSLLYGNWPRAYDEVILVVNRNNEISTSVLYQLGLLPAREYRETLAKLNNREEIEIKTHRWDYADISKQTFYLIPVCDYYVKNDFGFFADVSHNKTELNRLVNNGIELKIVGVVRLKEDTTNSLFPGNIGYTKVLTDYIIDYGRNSSVVQAQMATPNVNVLNGMSFTPVDDKAKITDIMQYIGKLQANPLMVQQMFARGESGLASAFNEYLQNPTEEALVQLYDKYISAGSYDANMSAFGLVNLDAPTAINIYADSFETKAAISKSIDQYNTAVADEDKITYTDFVELLMSSVTTIINVVSYVLIAFVAVSLVVSSIMIGIITYISVLERTKEIGILRAIGASKQNIAYVFNAETIIIGFLSGLFGVGIAAVLLVPSNAIIHMLTKTTAVNASLPLNSAVILIILSMCLTLIAGLIPSSKAAKMDPVVALRTE